MGVIAALIAYALPLVVVIAAIVWAVNLSRSVQAIQHSLERIERSRAVAPAGPDPAPAVPSAPAPSTPIDIDPFVD